MYPAVFEKDSVGFVIYFPDVDGATTQGDHLEEDMEMASDALGIQVAWNIENEGSYLPLLK